MIDLTVNGTRHEVDADRDVPLLPIERADQLRPAFERALVVVQHEGRSALADVVTRPR